MRADVRDGLRLLWHQPVLRALSVLTAGFNFASAGVVAVLFLGGPALTTEPLAVGAAAAIGGAGIALVTVVAVTLRQRVTPDAKLGRVIGAHRLLAWGTKPLGAAVAGVLAELLGLRAVFVVMATLVLALLVLLRGLSESALQAAEGGGSGTPTGVQTHGEGPSE